MPSIKEQLEQGQQLHDSLQLLGAAINRCRPELKATSRARANREAWTLFHDDSHGSPDPLSGPDSLKAVLENVVRHQFKPFIMRVDSHY